MSGASAVWGFRGPTNRAGAHLRPERAKNCNPRAKTGTHSRKTTQAALEKPLICQGRAVSGFGRNRTQTKCRSRGDISYLWRFVFHAAVRVMQQLRQPGTSVGCFSAVSPGFVAGSAGRQRPSSRCLAASAVVRCAASTPLKIRSPWSAGRPCAPPLPPAFPASGVSLRREKRCRAVPWILSLNSLPHFWGQVQVVAMLLCRRSALSRCSRSAAICRPAKASRDIWVPRPLHRARRWPTPTGNAHWQLHETVFLRLLAKCRGVARLRLA